MGKDILSLTGEVGIEIYDGNGNKQSESTYKNNVSQEFLKYAMGCFTDYCYPADDDNQTIGIHTGTNGTGTFWNAYSDNKYRSNQMKPTLGHSVPTQQYDAVNLGTPYTGGTDTLYGWQDMNTPTPSAMTVIQINNGVNKCIMEDIGGGVTFPTDYSFQLKGRLRDHPRDSLGVATLTFDSTKFGIIRGFDHAGAGTTTWCLDGDGYWASAVIDAEVKKYDTLVLTWTITINEGSE